MVKIEEKQHIRISYEKQGYIVEYDNLIKLAKLIENMFINSESDYKSFEITITTDQDVQFDYSSVNRLFKSKLEDELLNYFEITFYEHQGNYINMDISQFYEKIKIIIKSDNETWAKGTKNRIDDLIDTFTPQESDFKKKRNYYEWYRPFIFYFLIYIFMAISIGFIFDQLHFFSLVESSIIKIVILSIIGTIVIVYFLGREVHYIGN